MEADLLDDPVAFLHRARHLLLDDEARHNLVLGLSETIRNAPGVYPERRFWLVSDGDDVVAAGLRTPPLNLVLARPRTEEALATLAASIADDLPGVVGARPEVDRFALHWDACRGVRSRVVFAQGVYALERVLPVPTPPGRARAAIRSDVDLLREWLRAFHTEALHEGGPDEEQLERVLEHRLDSDAGGFALWVDDGVPVSLAGYGGPTPNGIRVGPVYTPTQLRGHGYATALVADLSKRLLAGGRRFCFLYTDLANATANAIYRRIGYEQVCESAQLAFDR